MNKNTTTTVEGQAQHLILGSNLIDLLLLCLLYTTTSVLDASTGICTDRPLATYHKNS